MIISMENAEREYYEIKEQMQDLKNQIHLLQSEIEDKDMELRNLDRWKSGRWIGFVLMFIATIVLFVLLLPYVKIYLYSMDNISEGKANMVNTSISATALIFGGLLLLVVFILTIITGIKTIAELGRSSIARSIAVTLGRKNYYAYAEPSAESKRQLEKSMFQLRMKLRDLEEKMAEKEKALENSTLDFFAQSNYNDVQN